MNILMLGNSFTYFNDMPGMLAEELNASVTEVVRGGAYLHSFLDQEDGLSQLGMSALDGDVHECDGRETCRTFGARPQGMWDYVVLQEQSFNAVGSPGDFLRSAGELCRRIWSVGAVPVIYGTWAYRDGSAKLKSTWLTHERMSAALRTAYARAAQEGDALFADVGAAFYRADFDTFIEDDYHPNEAASRLAARTIADAIRAHAHMERPCPEVELRPIDSGSWRECVRLRPTDEQSGFIASNSYILVQAAYEPDCYPLGVYCEGRLAGFAMYAFDAELGMWSVDHLMVDKSQQGRGISRAALEKLCAHIADSVGAVRLAIAADPDNVRALGLYRRLGFVPDGRIVHGEVLMIRQL